MKVVGITAEYNPFHNGHVYLAQTAREKTGADCVVAVMSGDFTQRGEPAAAGKWERAEAAVKAGGADLILELPFAFACSRADVFARGAVDMLAGLGADCITFGCEAADPGMLRQAAEMLDAEAESIGRAQSAFLKDGISSAKAYELAAAQVLGEETALLLQEPNNILALAYLKRIRHWRKQGRRLEDLPIRRTGSGYGEASAQTGFAGAGALRRMIREGEDISRYVPCSMDFADLRSAEERCLQILKGIVLRSGPEELSRCCGVGEGMEHRIIREVRKAEDPEQLLTALISKRYTGATVRRALAHILAGSTWETIDRITSRRPSAGRLLAANRRGREFMRTQDGAFKIVTNINKEEEGLSTEDAFMLKLDERAADIYNLLCGKEICASSDRVRRPYIEKTS